MNGEWIIVHPTASMEKLVRPIIVMPFGIEPTTLGMAKIVGLLNKFKR